MITTPYIGVWNSWVVNKKMVILTQRQEDQEVKVSLPLLCCESVKILFPN